LGGEKNKAASKKSLKEKEAGSYRLGKTETWNRRLISLKKVSLSRKEGERIWARSKLDSGGKKKRIKQEM